MQFTLEDKTEFVENIIDGAKESILSKINKIPDDWTPEQLRFYIKEHLDDLVWDTFGDKRFKPYRDYKKDCKKNKL